MAEAHLAWLDAAGRDPGRWRRGRRGERRHLSRGPQPQRALRGAEADLGEGGDRPAGHRLQRHGRRRGLCPAPLLGPPSGEARRASSSPRKTTRSMRSTPTGARIWERALGAPVPLSALPCGNIDPMGVTGTPTIDPDDGDRLSRSIRPDATNGPRHKVFGLSLATGEVAPGWPVDVENGLAALEARLQQRAPGPTQRADPGQRQALRPLCRALRRLRRL